MANGIVGQAVLAVAALFVAAVIVVQLFFVVEVWWRGGKGLLNKVLWTLVLLVLGWIGLFVYLMAGRDAPGADAVAANHVVTAVDTATSPEAAVLPIPVALQPDPYCM